MTDLATIANNLPADVAAMIASDLQAEIARLGSTGEKSTIRVAQNKKFILPDETEYDSLEVVIVDFVYRNEFYPGAYNPKDIQPPVCAAINADAKSLVPFENAPKRQHTSCAGCQQDAWGSSATGDGKACKNSVVLAVTTAGEDPNGMLYTIKSSPTAITAFNQYVAKVARELRLPLYAVQTKIFFDPKSTYATIRFECIGPNTQVAETTAIRGEARNKLTKPVYFTPRQK